MARSALLSNGQRRRAVRRLGVVVGAALLVTLMSGCLNDFDEVRLNRIWIGSIDVSAPEVRSGTVTLLVNVTLENSEATSGDVVLTVKAHNTATGLLEKSKDTEVGIIERDRTKVVPVSLVLPKQDGYRITAVLHQDEMRLQQASVQVSQVAALANTVAQTGLRVDELEFLVRNVTAGHVAIEAQVYLTNEGSSDSRPLELHLKAREVSTSLLAAEEWTDVDPIPTEATRVRSATLEVPESYNYLVEAVLWDGDFIVGKGVGKVQLLPTFTVPEDQEIVVDRPVVEDFLREDGGGDRSESYEDEATPAPALLLVLATIVGVVGWMRRRT